MSPSSFAPRTTPSGQTPALSMAMSTTTENNRAHLPGDHICHEFLRRPSMSPEKSRAPVTAWFLEAAFANYLIRTKPS
jgi:hypothetical protein